MDSRIHQLLNQVFGEQTLPDLVDRGLHLLGFDFERNPGMIAAGQMVALRASLAALALFRTRQLFEACMEFFHLPPVVIFDLSYKQVYRRAPDCRYDNQWARNRHRSQKSGRN